MATRKMKAMAVGAAVVCAVAIGGAASADIPAPDGAVAACYNPVTGNTLRVVDSLDQCASTEHPLTFGGAPTGTMYGIHVVTQSGYNLPVDSRNQRNLQVVCGAGEKPISASGWSYGFEEPYAPGSSGKPLSMAAVTFLSEPSNAVNFDFDGNSSPYYDATVVCAKVTL